MSSRTDTPYWKYHTQEKDYRNVPDDQFYPIHLESGGTTFSNAYEMTLFFHQFEHIWDISNVGMSYIMAGMGQVPISKYLLQWVRNTDPEVDAKIAKIYEEWIEEYENG